jgi:hypothetical protein
MMRKTLTMVKSRRPRTNREKLGLERHGGDFLRLYLFVLSLYDSPKSSANQQTDLGYSLKVYTNLNQSSKSNRSSKTQNS